MDLDFGRSSKKLQQEQERRRSEAKRRINEERAAAEIARKRNAELEEQIRIKHIEQERQAELVRLQQEEEERRTGGITFCNTFQALPAPGDEDKVLLPPSALQALSQQDAMSAGPMLFELTIEGGNRTHAGVLQFTSEEGTVGLPSKVCRSLALTQKAEREEGGGAVQVKLRYVRLPKAQYARVVPSKGLSQVGEIRAMLEHNLRHHATLTLGDTVQVWHRGKEFDLEVVDLKPEQQVSLIDTDMELELDLPMDTQDELHSKLAQDASKTIRGTAVSPPQQPKPSGISPIPQPMGEVDSDSNSDSDIDEGAALTLRDLPEEPAKGSEGVVTLMIRTRQGRLERSFNTSEQGQALYNWVEACGAAVRGGFCLVVPYPRKVVSPEVSLSESGLVFNQVSKLPATGASYLGG
ncbi:unnamed protein product [Chrysoparadoxa australica]